IRHKHSKTLANVPLGFVLRTSSNRFNTAKLNSQNHPTRLSKSYPLRQLLLRFVRGGEERRYLDRPRSSINWDKILGRILKRFIAINSVHAFDFFDDFSSKEKVVVIRGIFSSLWPLMVVRRILYAGGRPSLTSPRTRRQFGMTASDHNSDSLPISRDDAAVILEQADLAVQAGAPLAVGLRAMASEAVSGSSVTMPVTFGVLMLVGLVVLVATAWMPYLTIVLAVCVAMCAATICFCLLSYARELRSQIALREMARRLEEGTPLPQVLASLKSRVSPLILILLERGFELGRFDTVLHWAAEQGRRRRGLHWTLGFALTYPMFLLGVGFVVGSFLLIGIVPSFRKIFDDFGTELPVLTKVIIEISSYLVNYWPWILGFLLLTSIAVGVAASVAGSWLVTRKWSPFIPVIGPLFHLETLSEFCSLMAIFVECQMPIPKSLRLASRATHDQWLQSACDNLATDIERGHSSDTSALIVGIPVAISQLIREGSSSQSMAEALRGVGDLYSTRAEVNSKLVAVISEPFIIIVTAIGVGSTVAALYLPLIKLLNDLS
ncbi:MAG: Type secretion system domain protein, partial [Schlesneria sp.]|nr:Type secretion system domain protein [Schlesneria sp.]